MPNPIIISIDGARYRLVADIEPLGNQRASFVIHATHKESGRTSVVNQLNAILTVFFAERYPEDWPWEASWDRAMHWAKELALIAKTSVDSSWNQLAYLEQCFDEDRIEGEWANVVEKPQADTAEFDLVETVARSFLKDDPSVTEMQVVLNDPAKFGSFVEWIGNDLYDWLRDNWKSWITNERGVPVLDDDDAEDSDAA